MTDPTSRSKTDKVTTWRALWAEVWSGDPGIQYEAHRWLGYPFFFLGVRLGLRANHLTTLAAVLGLTAAPLFLAGGYSWVVAAVALLNLSLAVDTVDGPLARYRNETSEFGAWLAALGVILRTIAVWSCAALGTYWRAAEPLALVFGIIALGHLFLSYHLMITNKTYSFYRYREGAVAAGQRRRLGLEAGWVMLLSVFALLDQLYLLLIVFAGLGAVPWAILIVRAVQSHLHQERDASA